MNTIIPSLLQSNSKDLLDVLSNSGILSQQESSYIDFINLTFSNSGSFPTLELFLQEFPEVHPTVPLQLDSLSQYIANFITKRNNLQLSQKLMQLATKVSQSGLSTSDLNVSNNTSGLVRGRIIVRDIVLWS